MTTIRLSPSMLADWMTCRQLARYRMQGIQPTAPSQALTFGTIVHDVIGAASVLDAPGDVTGLVEAAEKRWRSANKFASADALQALDFACLFAEAVLPSYFKYWLKKQRKWTWHKTEEWFETSIHTLDDEDVTLIGRQDATFVDGKRTLLLETKTKSRYDAGILMSYIEWDLQTSVYLYALRKRSLKPPVAGVIYNLIKRPGHRGKKGETRMQLRERIREEVEETPNDWFFRFQYCPNAQQWKDAEAMLVKQVTDFVRWHRGDAPDYRNSSACENKYGVCPYLRLCATGELGADYTVKGKQAK